MANKEPANEVELIDRPDIVETFITEAALLHLEGTTITITFATTRVYQKTLSAPIESVRIVTARIAMPMQAAVGLRDILSRVIERYRRGTAMKAEPIASGSSADTTGRAN